MTTQEIENLKQWLITQNLEQDSNYYRLDFIVSGLHLFIDDSVVYIGLPPAFSSGGFLAVHTLLDLFGEDYRLDSVKPTINITVYNQPASIIIEFLTSLFQFNLVDNFIEIGSSLGEMSSSEDGQVQYLKIEDKTISCICHELSMPLPAPYVAPTDIIYNEVPLVGFSKGTKSWVSQYCFFNKADIVDILCMLRSYYKSQPNEITNRFIHLLREHKPTSQIYVIRNYTSYTIYVEHIIGHKKAINFSPCIGDIKVCLYNINQDGSSSLAGEYRYREGSNSPKEQCKLIYQNLRFLL